jgi:nitronate monooxygenase
MTTWPDRRLCDLLGIDVPIIQAPMAGANLAPLAIVVANAGALGSIPCAALTLEQARREVESFREQSRGPLHLNFFCHQSLVEDANRMRAWRDLLQPYYVELGVDAGLLAGGASRAPFDAATCAFVEDVRPHVVSFHFGLPEPDLVARVKATGATILSSATSVREARWLEAHGVDAVIAQGFEAGGHRGMFLNSDATSQVGTIALVPQVVDAVRVPVIAAGGIGDGRGIAAAFMLGASGVQLGTVYLLSPEATTSPVHRAALRNASDDATALTNLFSGKPARGIINRLMREHGPMSQHVPAFPLAGAALAPLRAIAEPRGCGDFMSLWSGQAPTFAQPLPAGELTRRLVEQALASLGRPVAARESETGSVANP